MGGIASDLSPGQGFWDTTTYPVITGDWNGDGRTDIGRVNCCGVVFHVSDGQGTWTAMNGISSLSPEQGFTDTDTYPVITGDWNGDWKTDIGRVNCCGVGMYTVFEIDNGNGGLDDGEGDQDEGEDEPEDGNGNNDNDVVTRERPREEPPSQELPLEDGLIGAVQGPCRVAARVWAFEGSILPDPSIAVKSGMIQKTAVLEPDGHYRIMKTLKRRRLR